MPEMPIGEFVQSCAEKIIDYCEHVDREEFSRLQDIEYSRNQFHISFPFFKIAPFQEDHVRYWVREYPAQGVKVRICSQWLRDHREYFVRYLNDKNIITGDDPQTEKEPVGDGEEAGANGDSQIFEIERVMQRALRNSSLHRLEEGLEISDDGSELVVSTGGRIDITAKDKDGRTVVIELKAGTAKREAVGQILSYMGDVAHSNPDVQVRGMLVAGDFDERTIFAASMVDDLSLHKYSINFNFEKL